MSKEMAEFMAPYIARAAGMWDREIRHFSAARIKTEFIDLLASDLARSDFFDRVLKEQPYIGFQRGFVKAPPFKQHEWEAQQLAKHATPMDAA